MRTRMSRPRLSVPSRNPAVPGGSGWPLASVPLSTLVWVALCPVIRESSGAAIASTTMSAITTMEASATRSVRSRATTSCRGVLPSMPPAAGSSGGVLGYATSTVDRLMSAYDRGPPRRGAEEWRQGGFKRYERSVLHHLLVRLVPEARSRRDRGRGFGLSDQRV